MAFDFGAFWFKGQFIRTGQANVKACNRRLAQLIHHGRAKPSQIISHRLTLAEAPDAYKHFDARDDGWCSSLLLDPYTDASREGSSASEGFAVCVNRPLFETSPAPPP